MRQHEAIGIRAAERRRAKAKKTKIGFFRCRAGEAAECAVAAEQRFRIVGQIARKGRDLGFAVEPLAIGGLAAGRCAEDGRQFFAAALRPGPRAWRGPPPMPRRRCRLRYRRPSRRPWQPSAAARPRDDRGLNGADDRPWSRRTGCGRSAAETGCSAASLRPIRKQSRIPASAASRSCSASGPALNAASASTSTIWRSSRAK